jgi:hypothetical protein
LRPKRLLIYGIVDDKVARVEIRGARTRCPATIADNALFCEMPTQAIDSVFVERVDGLSHTVLL